MSNLLGCLTGQTQINQSQIINQLLIRRKARSNLYSFCEYTIPNFKYGRHLKEICEALEKVESGEIKRLIISCPPQHGKSTTVDMAFINWCLGRNPNKKIVLASYASDRAIKEARRAQNLFYSSKYSNLFQEAVPQLNNKSYKRTADEYETSYFGGLYAVGIGGSLTGRGFDIGIIDDFYKDRQEANSPTTINGVQDWWRSVFLTRQSPTAAIIIIATRWAQDDLIGMLEKESKDRWTILNFPAVDEQNNYLWTEHFSKEFYENQKKDMSNFEWSALYLGEPTIKGGNRFKTGSVKIHDNIKDFPNVLYIRAWDLASSSKERNNQDPDYTVGVLGTIYKNNGMNELWIKDVICGRWEAPERDNIIKNTALKDGPSITQYVESYGAYKDAYTTLRRVLMGRNIVRNSILTGDKVVKASILEPIFEAGNVHLMRNEHTETLLKQFREFPFSKKDDMVDAVAIIAHENAKAKSGIMIVN